MCLDKQSGTWNVEDNCGCMSTAETKKILNEINKWIRWMELWMHAEMGKQSNRNDENEKHRTNKSNNTHTHTGWWDINEKKK